MKTETESTKHFKTLVRAFEMGLKHGNRTLSSLRQVKATAYKAANEYLWLTEHDPKGLDTMVRQHTSKTTLKWLDERFHFLTVLTGDNYHELIQSIRKGMTLQQYKDTTPKEFIYRHRRTTKVVKSTTQAASKMPASVPTLQREVIKVRERLERKTEAVEDWKSRALKAEADLEKTRADAAKWKKKYEDLLAGRQLRLKAA